MLTGPGLPPLPGPLSGGSSEPVSVSVQVCTHIFFLLWDGGGLFLFRRVSELSGFVCFPAVDLEEEGGMGGSPGGGSVPRPSGGNGSIYSLRLIVR